MKIYKLKKKIKKRCIKIYNDEEVLKNAEKSLNADKDNNYSVIKLYSILSEDIDKIYPHLTGFRNKMLRIIDDIRNSIQIIPLWGGGLNYNAEYQFLLVFNNPNFTAKTIRENCNYRDVITKKEE